MTDSSMIRQDSERSRAQVATMKDDFTKFRKRLLLFLFAPCLLLLPWLPFGVLFGPQILERSKGPSAQAQTDHAFRNAKLRDYDLVFLGNSRVYRGINPDHMDVPSYNFACDNDTYNQMYHKLKWLRETGKAFHHLVIGVDFFQFSFIASNRNHLYGPLLGDEYLADYPPDPNAKFRHWMKTWFRSLNPKYLFMPNNGRIFLRDNGQFIKPGVARATDTWERSTKLLPVQIDYFERILADCRTHGTNVVLCMLPIRQAEKNCYTETQIEEFMEFLQNYVNNDVALIDLTFDDGYVMSDYTDITHLNEAAADRLSIQLNGLLMPILNADSSTSHIPLASSDTTARQ